MKIFDLFGSIYVDTKEAEKSLQKTESGFEKVGNKVSNFGGKVANAGAKLTKTVTAGVAAVTGTVAAVTKLAETASSAADNIDKMSQKIGVSRQAYQELDFICSQSGMSVDTLQTGMKTLVSAMDKAASGTAANVEQFEKLGVSVTNADGSLRSQEEVMWEVFEALQGMSNEAEKARLASQLFGKSGTELMPLLNGTAGSIEEMKQKAHDLGLILSDDTIDAGVKLTDTMDQVKRSFQTVGVTLGAELIPYVQEGADYIIAHMPQIRESAKSVAEVIGAIGSKAGAVIDWFSKLDEGQQKTILKMAGIVAAAGPVLTIAGKAITIGGTIISGVQKLSTVFGAVSKGAGLLQAGLALVPAPILLIVAVIAAVIAAGVLLYKNWDTVKEKAGQLKEWITGKFNELKENISTAVQAFADKFPAAFAFIKSVFDSWNQTVTNVISGVKQVFQGIIQFFTGVFTGDWSKALDGLKNIFSGAFKALSSLAMAPLNALKGVVSGTFNAIDVATGGKLSKIKDRITENLSAVKQAYEEHGGGVAGIVAASQEVIRQHYQAGYAAINALTGGKLDEIKERITENLSAVKQAYEEHGGGVAGIVAASQEVIRQHYQASYDAINALTGGKLDEIKDKITENLSAVKQTYEEHGGGVAGIVAASQEVIRQHYQASYDAINALTGGKLDEIKDKITEKLTAAGDFVQASVERIKGFFNFEWKLPDIKLPHFNLEGEFSLKPPSVPKLSVDWYAKAMNQPMIMTKPTAFGINANGEVMAGGEKGSEVVSGTDTLMGMIKSAVSDVSGSGITKDEMYSVIVAAVSYVLQKYGMQLFIELDTDKDELFKKVVAKNNEFKKMHQGRSALSDDRPAYA